MGEGRHASFTLHAGGARSRCVRFGQGTRLHADPGVPIDAAVRLEANRWNGAVEPRLVFRHARAVRHGAIDVLGEPAFEAGLAAELARPLAEEPAALARHDDPAPAGVRDVRGTGIAGVLADLVACGEPVLAVVAHAPHRARALAGVVGGFAVCSWAALEDDPDLAAPFAHVVAIDPPASIGGRGGPAASPGGLGALVRASGGARAHLAWGPPELGFARRIHQWDFALREPLAGLYRALREAGEVRGEACETVLRGEGPQPRSAALAGRLVRVLSELDLVVVDRDGWVVRAADSPERTALERSPAYRAYQRRLEDGLRYLTSDTIQQAA
jgi:single-stranded-DNA-specific exonuclease